MKLRSSTSSPFVRKVRVVAHELGLADRIELVPTNPFESKDLRAENPLAKVPALVADDGSVLFDSPVICEYLDWLAGGYKLFPEPGPQRWRALRLQALGDGIADAAVARRLEGQRPNGERSAGFIQRQRAAILAGLDQIERGEAGLTETIGIGELAVACALGYLDFRFADESWRERRPRLAHWFETVGERPSMVATRPA